MSPTVCAPAEPSAAFGAPLGRDHAWGPDDAAVWAPEGGPLPQAPDLSWDLAATIDEPSDLVQPRAESPAYTMRRNTAFEKYRKGVSTTTIYPEGDKAKLSDTGK